LALAALGLHRHTESTESTENKEISFHLFTLNTEDSEVKMEVKEEVKMEVNSLRSRKLKWTIPNAISDIQSYRPARSA
jgi:hypothetical protein